MVHEDISSGGSSPVTGHAYDGTRDKLVTDKKGGAGNKHSHITEKKERKTPTTNRPLFILIVFFKFSKTVHISAFKSTEGKHIRPLEVQYSLELAKIAVLWSVEQW